MDSPDPAQSFLDELERVRRMGAEARRVLDEAEAVYGPAPDAPAAPSKDPGLPSFLRDAAPDRWVTLPLWILWVTVIHMVVAAICLAGLGFAIAVLAYIGSVVDLFLGAPVARPCAVVLGVAAVATHMAQSVRSYLTRLRKCPW